MVFSRLHSLNLCSITHNFHFPILPPIENRSRQKSTELSNYIWELKENGENYKIDWLIAMKAHPYICGMRKCDLCLCEKLVIARANSANLLNKRDELVSKCLH